MDQHPLIGKILADDYQIVSFLGKGGMGTVFVAHQISLNRQVAIKILPLFDLSPEQICRFESEIEAMATLCHPNIVTVHHRDRYGDPPTLYYVMELLEGGSLKNYLQQYGKLPPSIAVRQISQIAEALSYAHEQGCIHRDIKPDNLLYTRNYRSLKIADFGIVKLNKGISITQSQSMVGTFLYAAPEQMNWFEGEGEEQNIDTRADQYSLGIVLYEMIAGRLPYEAKNLMEMMKSFSKPPAPISSTGVSVSPSLEWLINMMIATSREKRFPNDEALLEAISNVEMDVAATSSTRIYAIKSTDCFDVPPPPRPKGDYFSRNDSRKAIQSLQTIISSPLEGPSFLKNRFMGAILSISVLAALTIVGWALLSKIQSSPKNGSSVEKPDSKKSTAIDIEINLQYDVPPPEGYPPIQLTFVSEQQTLYCKLNDRIEPGRYQLFVILPGYTCSEHGKIIVVPPDKKYLLTLKLTSIPRKISGRILNLATHQVVEPLSFLVDGQKFSEGMLIKPGQHRLLVQFKDYHEIDLEVQVPPGNGSYQYQTMLVPLKEVMFSCKTGFDDSHYPVEVWVDGTPLSLIHFQYKSKNGLLNLSVKLSNKARQISIRQGFYYLDVPVDQLYLASSLDGLDGNRLMDELRKQKENLSQMWDHLWKNDREKMKKWPVEMQKQFYAFLVERTSESDCSNMDGPIWLLRQLLDEQEAKERGAYLVSIQKKEADYKKRQEIWENFLKEFPGSAYAKATQSRIKYEEEVKQYETSFRGYVQDCYLSTTEKRILQRTANKLRPEDVTFVHQSIARYLKELKCNSTLEEMLKK